MNNLNTQTAYVGSAEITQVRKGDRLVLAPNGNKLWYDSNELPSLDLRFAEDKSLVDATTGSNLVDFTRASSGTYVGSDRLIKTATTNLLLQSEFQSNWALFNTASLDPNQALAPDGLTTAALNTSTDTTDYVYSIPATTIGAQYVFSFYIKAGTSTRNHWHVRTSSTVAFGQINWSSGTIASLDVGVGSATFVDAGNGWYRVSVVYTAAETNARHRIGAGDNTSTIGTAYLWGAQLEQSSTVGEYVKTTSTINSAPRFDHDPTTGESLGLLVEESRTNLLEYSEEFDQTTWSASGASVSADQTIAPDGNTTADKLVCGTGTPIYQGIQQAITATSSATRFSVYVKAAEIDQVELRSFNPADLAIFELSTQQVLSQSGSPDPTITDAGNGWYRCSITSSSSAATSFRISLASGGNRTFTPIPGAGLYLWGAQLEQSSTVGEYIPTTSTINSAPRFDHDPTTGESLGLLVEEERTNLIEYSEDLTDPYWGVGNLNGTITANQAAAPDGTITANLYTEDNTTNGRFVSRGSISYTSGTFYTVSVWAKQASGTRYAGLILPATAFGIACQVRFTLSGSGSYYIRASGTGTTASIQQFSNGWYRCSLTSQATVTTTSGGVQLRLLDDPTDGSFAYTGDGTSGIYLWGAQLEAGSFPTSYIPTEGSTVTRSADVASITGANFSSWYRQDEGTVFVDFQLNTVSVNNLAFSINDNSFANRQAIYTPTTTSLRYRSITSNTNDVAISFATIAGGRRKAVGAYKVNDFAFALDTGDFQTDTSAAVPPATQLNIGSEFNGAASLNNTIRRFTYWPARLPNETLQTITQ